MKRRVRFLAEVNDFSVFSRTQTNTRAHWVSRPVNTGGYFPGGKVAGA
jgi:hypothetical protein